MGKREGSIFKRKLGGILQLLNSIRLIIFIVLKFIVEITLTVIVIIIITLVEFVLNLIVRRKK